jgi:integrase
LQALTGGHVNALYRELDEAGLSVSTRRLTHAVLHRALSDAVRWGRLVRNPADAADPPAAARSKATAWTPKELGRFLRHVNDDRLCALWRLAAMTGCRRGELAAVMWRGLDLDADTLTISAQLVPTRGGCTFGPPKSSRGLRTIALDALTVDILRGHREAQLLERAVAGDAYDDLDLAFCDELGGPLNPQHLTDRFTTLRAEAGIGAGSLHILRHTHATHLLVSGVPVHVVAARLGDTPATVMSVYAHLLPTSDAAAASRVAALVDGAR